MRLPLENDEVEALFGEPGFEVLDVLEEAHQVGYNGRWYWAGTDYPAKNVNIRSSSSEAYNIVSVERDGTLLGTVDGSSAFDIVHPGAGVSAQRRIIRGDVA